MPIRPDLRPLYGAGTMKKDETPKDTPLWLAILKLPFQAIAAKLRGTLPRN